VDNEHQETVKAPIFDPHYLLFGLLLAQGVTPPIPLEKLLIASPPPELLVAQRSTTPSPAGEEIKTNSNLVLPGGAGSYSDSPPPDRAFSTSGSKDLLELFEKMSVDMRGEGAAENSLKIRVMNDGERQVYHNSPFVVHYDTTTNQGGVDQILFRLEEDAETFNSLPATEKGRFLLYLTEQYISEMIASSPTYYQAKALLERPGEVMRREKVESIRSAINFLKDIGRTIANDAGHIAAIERAVGVQVNPNAAGEYNELLSQIPSYQYLVQQQDKLGEAILNRPENYILLMDRLSPEKRQLLMEWIEQAYLVGPSSEGRFFEVIASRRLIGVGKREGFEPLKVKVNLVYMPNSPVDLPTLTPPKRDERPEGTIDQKGQKGVGKKGERIFPTEIEARHYISAETMIDLILRFGGSSREVAARWNRSLSQEYRRMTKENPRDGEFLRIVPNLIRAYPKQARTKRIEIGEQGVLEADGSYSRNKMLLMVPPDLFGLIEEIRRDNPLAYKDFVTKGANSNPGLEGDIVILRKIWGVTITNPPQMVRPHHHNKVD
ncbi:MAG: hypothetical protein HYY44_05070, partial [Deltaproteobacteria bacterium]|nr:hypothetical protein [Deltaproteobacteria bacterium]